MDTPSANPIPQQPASRVVQSRPAPISIPAGSDYACLDDGVFQKVKELHVQVEDQLKSLPVNEVSITDSVDAIVALDCPLPAKFTKLDVSELLKKNKNIKVRRVCESGGGGGLRHTFFRKMCAIYSTHGNRFAFHAPGYH